MTCEPGVERTAILSVLLTWLQMYFKNCIDLVSLGFCFVVPSALPPLVTAAGRVNQKQSVYYPDIIGVSNVLIYCDNIHGFAGFKTQLCIFLLVTGPAVSC